MADGDAAQPVTSYAPLDFGTRSPNQSSVGLERLERQVVDLEFARDLAESTDLRGFQS